MSENGGYIPKLATLIGKIMIHQWIGITCSIHPPGNSHHHRRSTSCLVSSQAPRSSEACCVLECPGCGGEPPLSSNMAGKNALQMVGFNGKIIYE